MTPSSGPTQAYNTTGISSNIVPSSASTISGMGNMGPPTGSMGPPPSSPNHLSNQLTSTDTIYH
jgi:hypothetical protein